MLTIKDLELLKNLLGQQLDEKLNQKLEPLKSDLIVVKTTQEEQGKEIHALKSDLTTIKTTQQEQGKEIHALKSDLTTIKTMQQEQGEELHIVQEDIKTLDMKIEAVHTYQKKAHLEIMENLVDSNEGNGEEQKKLEKRITRIEAHIKLPQLNH